MRSDIIVTSAKGGYVLFVIVCMFFLCLSVRQQDHLKCNKRICMNFLPKVCLEPRKNPVHFWDDPDYNPNPSFKKTDFCVGPINKQTINKQ